MTKSGFLELDSYACSLTILKYFEVLEKVISLRSLFISVSDALDDASSLLGFYSCFMTGINKNHIVLVILFWLRWCRNLFRLRDTFFYIVVCLSRLITDKNCPEIERLCLPETCHHCQRSRQLDDHVIALGHLALTERIWHLLADFWVFSNMLEIANVIMRCFNLHNTR